MRATRYHPSMHLEATQLFPAQDRCPVCGSEAPRKTVGVIQRNPSISLLRCSKCGGCSASHLPKPEVLDDYYSRYFQGDGPKITFPQIQRFVSRLRELIPDEMLTHHLRILDFGGGDGTLGLALSRQLLSERPERTVDFTLVDYQKPGTSQTDDRLKITHRYKLEEVAGPFDLVLASAVLEHIPKLQPVMQKLFSMLAPGGWFYARTPYVMPLKRLMPGLDITYPGHVHDLGAPFWNRVARTYDQPLRILVSRPSPVESHLLRQPGRTVAAHLLKLPARVELAMASSPRTPWWRIVGGWEVLLQRQPLFHSKTRHRQDAAHVV